MPPTSRPQPSRHETFEELRRRTINTVITRVTRNASMQTVFAGTSAYLPVVYPAGCALMRVASFLVVDLMNISSRLASKYAA